VGSAQNTDNQKHRARERGARTALVVGGKEGLHGVRRKKLGVEAGGLGRSTERPITSRGEERGGPLSAQRRHQYRSQKKKVPGGKPDAKRDI